MGTKALEELLGKITDNFDFAVPGRNGRPAMHSFPDDHDSFDFGLPQQRVPFMFDDSSSEAFDFSANGTGHSSPKKEKGNEIYEFDRDFTEKLIIDQSSRKDNEHKTLYDVHDTPFNLGSLKDLPHNIVRGAVNDYQKMIKLFEYCSDKSKIMDKNFKDQKTLDTFWNAEKVLKRRAASCCELACTYVAMAREVGLKARYMDAIVGPNGETIGGSYGHACAQVILPNGKDYHLDCTATGLSFDKGIELKYKVAKPVEEASLIAKYHAKNLS